jgi:WD40 repeat protein
VPELTMMLLHDAEQMFQIYRTPMASHALHVYHSALATMPRSSLLDVMWETLRTSIPELISSRELGWDPRRVLEGHTNIVHSVIFSPEGTRIASGSKDGTVRIWDTQTGGQLAKLQHQYGVRSVAYSADMKCIATRDFNGQEKQWDVTSIGALCVQSFATVC